ANAMVIIPMNTGKNDLKELDFILDRLGEFGVKEKARVVFTKTRQNSKSLQARKKTIKERGLIATNWVMPMLEDFSEQRHTSRTRNEISAFLHEAIL
ncbi:ParA family protein, partial [Vibrio parahaemolyticus]